MSWAVVAVTAIGAAGSAYNQHQQNKANEKADASKNQASSAAYDRAENQQQSANNFALANQRPWIRGGLNAWNAMQDGMAGDGRYNNYDPNAPVTSYGLPESLSGVEGGWYPGKNSSDEGQVGTLLEAGLGGKPSLTQQVFASLGDKPRPDDTDGWWEDEEKARESRRNQFLSETYRIGNR